jgi:hypothetical protein
MLQKLLQKLAALRQHQLEVNASPITGDVAYEAGRRLGVIQGVTLATKTIHDFIADTDQRDGDL